MKQQKYKASCRKCGAQLIGITRRIRQLEREGEDLRKKNAELREQLTKTEVGTVIASLRKSTFHKQECEYAEYLHSGNARTFPNRDTAIQAGYNPCKTCCS